MIWVLLQSESPWQFTFIKEIKRTHLTFPRVKICIVTQTNEQKDQPFLSFMLSFPEQPGLFFLPYVGFLFSIRKYLKNINEVFWSVNGCMYNIVCFQLKINSALHYFTCLYLAFPSDKNHSHTLLKYFHKISGKSR